MTRRYVAPALSLPQVSDASAVRKWMEKVNNLLTVREGMLGDSLDQNVTFRDLFEAGLTKEYINGVYQAWGGGNNSGTIPATADGPANYDIPPTPTGLVVASGIGVNILQWTNPATLYGNHAYTEVWRSATNNLGAAVKISTWTFHLAEDTLGTTNTTYYYWIRFVSKSNKYSAYNAGATSGVAGTTAYVVASNIFVTNLSAINADMGSITAGTITGGTIQTAASGARIVMNASDFIGYSAASVAQTTISGATGLLTAINANITGTITTTTLNATGGTIGGATISSTTLANGTNIILDWSNKKFSINSATFGAQGIQLDYNAGAPRAYFGDGATKFMQFDANGFTIGRGSKVYGTNAYSNDDIFWSWSTDSIDGFQNSVSNGGSFILINSTASLSVTTTSNSSAACRKILYGNSAATMSWSKNRRVKFLASIDAAPGTNQTWHIGLYNEDFVADGHYLTFRLKASSLALYAVSKDGTTETETNLSTTIADSQFHLFEIDFISATSAKFYYDTVLKGTITTNLPTSSASALSGLGWSGKAVGVSSSTTSAYVGRATFVQDP